MPDDPTKQEHHVTELAGPDDRWVSVTDASRIARRQEHTIRTWIAQGILPVNPVRVGMNKKTRQVRLSDLSKLTPIIDPDAGIATNLGTLDLPSIPKQQQQVMEQMSALHREVTGEIGSLGDRLHDLAGKYEQFVGETRQTWQVQQQQLQQVRDHLTGQISSYSQKLQQTQQNLSTLIAQTEQTLRQVFSDQMGHSEATLRQALEVAQASGLEATEQVRGNLADLQERLVSAGEKLWEAHEGLATIVTDLHAHTDQQFSQVASRIDVVETTLEKLQDEVLKQTGDMGQFETELLTQISKLATQVTELQSTWQERATVAEEEVRQLRQNLDAQGRFQQTLQEQLDEERKAREELSLKVSKLFLQNQ